MSAERSVRSRAAWAAAFARLLPGLLPGLLISALASSSCYLVNTQRWPEPMKATRRPLPPGDSAQHLVGPEEVSILRHADPVQVRPAGSLSGVPMAFYEKKARLTAGGAVLVSAGGRAEVLWPEGSSIVIFGQGVGWVGSPSRGEPMFEFQELERARLELREGEQVRLLGGAILRGASGPYLLERVRADLVRVRNQSKGLLNIAFREESFELGPGEGLLLPLVSAGGAPFSEDQTLQRITGPGFQVLVRGELEPIQDAAGVRLRASGDLPEPRELRALGVRVRLAPGEEVRFGGLERSSSQPAARATEEVPPPAPVPTPEPDSPADPIPEHTASPEDETPSEPPNSGAEGFAHP